MPNRLAHALSPYLLQHALNPVDWFEWGNEAWNRAKNENKLVIVSIGYSACHWCHVMEHETFENEESAAIMNDFFVSIKVDREERPDVDMVYMEACQLMTGRGGWPLNVICMPDGRPIHAGTYYPKSQWDDILIQLATFWKNKPEQAHEYGARLSAAVASSEFTPENASTSFPNPEQIGEALLQHVDPVWGGFNWAPKFPMPPALRLFFTLAIQTKNEQMEKHLQLTLTRMALGGIYDQIGGGFARYSVDGQWKVPHFEKMLYDNAQLIELYAWASAYWNDAFFNRIYIQSFHGLQRDFLHENGLFYSAWDADSEGVEGKFYIWTPEAFFQITGDNGKYPALWWGIGNEGLWEQGQYILWAREHPVHFSSKHQISPDAFYQYLDQSIIALHQHRKERVHPGIDDKILTSWNALQIKALARAGMLLNHPESIAQAIQTAEALLLLMKDPNGILWRVSRKGIRQTEAFLEDYAYLAEAFIYLYQATWNEKWLHEADALVQFAEQHFSDDIYFWFTNNTGEALFARKRDLQDDVMPSANAVMAELLYILGTLKDHLPWVIRSQEMIDNIGENALKFPTGFVGFTRLKYLFPDQWIQVVYGEGFQPESIIEKANTLLVKEAFLARANPNSDFPYLSSKAGKPELIQVCQGRVCYAPVNDLADISL